MNYAFCLLLLFAGQTAKPNLSAEFSKAAMKALIAERDTSELSVDAAENAESVASTPTEESAFKGIEAYQLWKLNNAGTSPAINNMVEAAAPSKCFVNLKAQYSSRVWVGVPRECSISDAKR